MLHTARLLRQFKLGYRGRDTPWVAGVLLLAVEELSKPAARPSPPAAAAAAVAAGGVVPAAGRWSLRWSNLCSSPPSTTTNASTNCPRRCVSTCSLRGGRLASGWPSVPFLRVPATPSPEPAAVLSPSGYEDSSSSSSSVSYSSSSSTSEAARNKTNKSVQYLQVEVTAPPSCWRHSTDQS